jgi:hypothetical protein
MRQEVVLFPEIVEQGIKQRVSACSKKERKWILEAFEVEELQAEVAERMKMHKSGEQALVDIAKKIEWRDRALKEGVY